MKEYSVKRLAVVMAASALLVLVGCGESQQIRDLENVVQTQPDKARLVTNVDQYANVVAICIEGEGFVTTTRDYNAITHIPEWSVTKEGWCARDD